MRQSASSPTLRSAAALGLGGIGFALGNLLLARELPEAEFGKVSVLLSLIQVGAAFGVAGIPTLINRHHWNVTPTLLRMCALGAAAAGAAAAWIAHDFYDLAPALAWLLAAAIVLAALGQVAGAFFQSRERFGVSLLLNQSHNWLPFASVPIVLLLGRPEATTVTAVLVASYVAVTGLGIQLAVESPSGPTVTIARERWREEGLSAAGLMLGSYLLFQLDKLLIAALLTLDELIALPAAATIMLLMPWLTDRFFSGRYEVRAGLLLLIIAIGLVRIWEAVMSAIVSALGSTRESSLLNMLSWLAIVLSTACAASAASFGLLGVVCALGTGWWVLALGASVLAVRAWSRLR